LAYSWIDKMLPLWYPVYRGITAMRNLTDAICKNTKPAANKRLTLRDHAIRGLELRITERGVKTWSVHRRINGKQIRYTIGEFPGVDLQTARKAAQVVLSKIALDGDPVQERRDRESAERGADTFRSLTERYLSDPETKTQRRVADKARLIEKHLLPAWGGRKAKDITSAEILALVEKYGESAPTGANRLLSVIREVFRFGVKKFVVSANPAAIVEKSIEHNEHCRAATDDELNKLWLALDSEPLLLSSAYRLLALTGCRRGEVWGMKWSELDLQSRLWILPAERVKNGRAHRVPLVGQALEILLTLDRAGHRGEYVFPDDGGRKEAHTLRELHQRICKAANVDGFKIHGLRSTVATGLANLGVLGEIQSRVLNHAIGKEGAGSKITLVYNQASYDGPKRAALELWDAHVRTITGQLPEIEVQAG
jgi:integrase